MIFYVVLIVLLFVIMFNNTSLLYRERGEYRDLRFSDPIKGGEPFEYRGGNSRAILFIHGFPGSPKMFYLVRQLAIKDGYDVFSPRLPGFSSTKEEFIHTNFSMWFNYIKDFYLAIRGDYKDFYIIGHSMGGALTLKLCEFFSNQKSYLPRSVAVISAPVFLNSFKRGVLLSPLLYFVRTVALFYSYIPARRPRKSKEFDEDGDTEWVGYRGRFPKQILSLKYGLKKVKRDLKKVDLPIYLCQAEADKTVSYKNLDYIDSHITSSKKRVETLDLSGWNHTNHSLFIYKSVVGSLWKSINSFFKEVG